MVGQYGVSGGARCTVGVWKFLAFGPKKPTTIFYQYIGIDYSGAQTPTASLRGLRVYSVEGEATPVEVLSPPAACMHRRHPTKPGRPNGESALYSKVDFEMHLNSTAHQILI